MDVPERSTQPEPDFGICFAVILFALMTIGVVPPRSAEALPTGKAWSAVVDTFKVPGHTFGVAPRRLETDGFGPPLAFVDAFGGIGADTYVLRWSGSSWQAIDHLGYGTKGVQPVPSPEGAHHLIWAGTEDIMTDRRVSYLVMDQLVDNNLTRPDTITTISVRSLTYGAAASQRRRWAAVGDFGDLRLLYSDGPSVWKEVAVAGRGDRSVAMGAIDDTTALLAWRDLDLGPGAGILKGSTWNQGAAPPMNGHFDGGPLLRLRPSGGYWLSWATEMDFVGIASYRDGAWSPPESVFCAYLRPEAHYAQSRAEMSSDGAEYPAVSWMAASSLTGLTSVCVCVPSESGFTVAENLLGSEGGEVPVVARDRNQDVWVAWQAPSGMGWTHTYTRATSSTPTINGTDGERIVAWTLSEPAPGSWWAVLRAEGIQPFVEVARVRAGDGLAMDWTDLSRAGPPIRYRIRRECLDTQYQWTSEEVLWPSDGFPPSSPRGPLVLLRGSSNPSNGLVRFEVLNAGGGTLEVQIYDLGGRLLLQAEHIATGSGKDAIEINLASAATTPGAGLYFVRLTDSSGRISPCAKLVLLR